MQRQSITDYLPDFERRGRATAYVYRRGYRNLRSSYADLAALAYRFARELETRGIGPGDRVLLWGDNCAEWIGAFFGCVLRGAAAVPMDRIASPDFALRVAQQVSAKLIVASADLQSVFAPAFPTLPLEDLTATLSAHSAARYTPHPSTPDDTVEIVFTSGTTSEPKGVVISHRNILASVLPIEREMAKYLRYERPFHPIRFLNLLPLSHVFGQFMGIFIPQLMGGEVFFQEALNPNDVIAVIRRERISVCITVPRLLESLRGKLERDGVRAADIPGHFLRRWWKYRRVHRQLGWKFWAFICGGAALDTDLEEFWRRLGYIVIQGYGMTESTSLISVNHPFKMGRRSIGKVLPGRDLKLDENGEILVRGENIARSYFTSAGLQPVAADEGWLRTGDLGEIDADGNLYFKGRKKNVIVTPEGLKIYPEDLEAALKAQPEVRDAAVVALMQGGNAVPAAAVIPLHNGHDADIRAAVARANDSLADFQRIRQWILWPDQDFPRTGTHKPRTNLIAERIASTLGGAAASLPETDTLHALLARMTRGRIAPNAKLDDDLQLSSLDRVELAAALEDRYLTPVDDSALASARTVADLEAVLRHQTAAPADAPAPYPYSEWQMRAPFTWLRRFAQELIVRPAVALMAHPRVVGAQQIRSLRAPVLTISNHVTYVDIGFLLYALPRRLRSRLIVAMSGEMLRAMRHPPRDWNPLHRWFEQLQYFLVVALFNVQPLPQQSDFRHSFDHLGRAADRGYSIVVFPEGRRTDTGAINPFRSGIGLLATRLGIPILPMRLDGLFALAQKHQRFARPGAVSVRIGEPVTPKAGDPETIARDLEERVRSL